MDRERKAKNPDSKLFLFCAAALLCILIYAIGGQRQNSTDQGSAGALASLPSEQDFLLKAQESLAIAPLGGDRYSVYRGEGLSDGELIPLVNARGVYGFSLLAEKPLSPEPLGTNPTPAETSVFNTRSQVWERNMEWLDTAIHALTGALYGEEGEAPSYDDVELLCYYAALSLTGEKKQETKVGCSFRAYVSKNVLHISIERAGD